MIPAQRSMDPAGLGCWQVPGVARSWTVMMAPDELGREPVTGSPDWVGLEWEAELANRSQAGSAAAGLLGRGRRSMVLVVLAAGIWLAAQSVPRFQEASEWAVAS